jgi:hypothetical protein
MNVDQQTRDQLRALTENVVGGPDLHRVLRDGGRRRRRRTATVGIAALAVAGLAVGTAYQVSRGTSHATARDRSHVATAPAIHDFVPETDLDETFQVVVSGHLPGVGDASKVYPSDWNHDFAIPDWEDATDWEMRYGVGADVIAVVLGKPAPGQADAGPTCEAVSHVPEEGQPPCTRVDVAGGGYLLSDSYVGVPTGSDSQPVYVFNTTYVRPDGSSATVQQRLVVATWHQAVAGLAFSPSQLRPLVTDPELDFPDPLHMPPPPDQS